MSYHEFITNKLVLKRETRGIEDVSMSPRLFPFQRELVAWALRTGKAALFAECGLGKTPMQLEWARHVATATKAPVLILAPLAVSQQTIREGEKFGIPVVYAHDQGEVGAHLIVITNYERLSKFDADVFGGVVLDESGIIKNFSGKVKAQIFSAFRATAYKLACSATPAPNDHMELGQHAEFLDVLTSHEMIARWFINDSSSFGTYRLKGHATQSFWDWVSSWARCVGTPSHLGFSDEGYVLPPMRVVRHVVDVDLVDGRGDMLFRLPDLSATAVHAEKRRSAPARARKVAEIVRAEPQEPWLIWCETDYEEQALLEVLPDAVAVNGKQDLETKERGLMGFVDGLVRFLVIKPSIGAFGLNLQRCARMAFVGPTFSFEQFYQATRRAHRFGQAREVVVHVVMGAAERGVWDVLQRKAEDHQVMQREMFAAVQRAVGRRDDRAKKYEPAGAWPLAPFIKGDAA